MFSSLLLLTPFSLVSLILWPCVRIVSLVTKAWWEFLMAIIGFCLDLCSKIMVWALAILTLPLRPFTALYREIKLEEQLREMKSQMEDLASENKELGQCLLLAVKETDIVEKVFQEIEDDYEKAIAKISFLENKIHDLSAQGKGFWDWKSSSQMSGGIPSWAGACKEGGVSLQDVTIQGKPWSDDEGKERRLAFPKRDEGSLKEQKLVAFQRSVFSTALSLLVGGIIWKAEDPCMPLVAALFTVVGMSLGSVVHFFSTIKNKPASGTVVLLSINCFMLGTLSFPTLPRVARMWSPWAMKAVDWFFHRLGFSS